MMTTPSHTRPSFVVFEGLDGSGKSTLADAFAAASGAHYMTTPSATVRQFRERLIEDYGTCQEARQLFYLSTVFAASAEIRQMLAAGRSVALDRYFLSTQAYAEFRGSSLDLDGLSQALLPADLTVYLDAPVEVRRARIRGRGASNADLETLTPSADAQLRRLHSARGSLPVVGQLLWLDSGHATVDELLAEVQRAHAQVLADPSRA